MANAKSEADYWGKTDSCRVRDMANRGALQYHRDHASEDTQDQHSPRITIHLHKERNTNEDPTSCDIVEEIRAKPGESYTQLPVSKRNPFRNQWGMMYVDLPYLG